MNTPRPAYHATIDGFRDVSGALCGLGPCAQAWPMIVLVVAGGLLLWRADWRTLEEGGRGSAVPSPTK